MSQLTQFRNTTVIESQYLLPPSICRSSARESRKDLGLRTLKLLVDISTELFLAPWRVKENSAEEIRLSTKPPSFRD